MSLASPHRTTGEMVTASIWNTDVIDKINSLAVSSDGATWQGRVAAAPSATAPFNLSYAANAFTGVIAKHPSGGTHDVLIGLQIDAPVIGSGPAAVTKSATVLITGAPSGAAANWGLIVDAGARSSFTGQIDMITAVNEGISFSDGLVSGSTLIGGYLGPNGGAFSLICTTAFPLILGSNNIAQVQIAEANVAIDLHASDGEYLTFSSTGDVAHGFTSDTATQSFGHVRKAVDASGGLRLMGYTEAGIGLQLDGLYTTGDTGKVDTSSGAVIIRASKLSGTTHNVMAADENLLVLRNDFETEFIFDNSGHLYYNGAAPSNYDLWDDIALTRCLDLTFRGPDLIETAWDRFVTYNRADLERAGIVSAGGFVDMTRHTRLLNGAIWQLFQKLSTLADRVESLEAA